MAYGAPTPAKFQHPDVTADGKPRARAPFVRLKTLWANTGTLCNIECAHCYIESSPRNDRLAYLSAQELRPYLDEAKRLGAHEIGFTGGEPFMNPDMPAMLCDALAAGFRALVLTNAMRPMMRPRVQAALAALRVEYGERLVLRVSLDHYAADRHDAERGPGAFEEAMRGLSWLAERGFAIAAAGRTLWGESEEETRAGYRRLFAERQIPIDADDPSALVLFPEMDERAEVPEISEACWDILGRRPDSVMCASSRMIVKRRGAPAPSVLACTLIPYSPAFELGRTLAESLISVPLNHPHCARFCVLGGAGCSG
ncbi:radical SAM protein [Amphiplicatus metriothermophilus]|uniref:4Fe-4S single cluster domain-containing protein n=1 Tax=Amphiplicatus metriothermophilus TaxID=1519374 RepID=A0A239PKN2_9PROT|nr:radical SAM protein [Amphiplicatus metriothermophilus]MBB5517478.1 putative Fe-S cluster-containing radical SAM superfamily protein [Amphiplicatus metriothermophilus]SNT68187.1 4Fe-4S single cluster domain-containing protein [Amphiplicatus metriothermophilus]